MNWQIPPPYPVPEVRPLRWSTWWRVFSLACIVALMLGFGSYFWLKNGRILLYTFITLVALCLFCSAVAGWMLFRFGVANEHAAGITRYNQRQEEVWQCWAQTGIPLLSKSFVLPVDIPMSEPLSPALVNSHAFSPGDYPGHRVLLFELLVPLLISLQTFLRQHSLVVYLPPLVPARDFFQVWQDLGLPASVVLSVEKTPTQCFTMLYHWAEDSENRAGRLLIFSDWQGHAQHTQGAVAWLLGPNDYQGELPVICTLHRPLPTTDEHFISAVQQFLHYQPVAQSATDLWLDNATQPYIAELLVQRAASLPTNTSPLLQHYLPHWLGKTGEGSAWLAVTLIMQRVETQRATQMLLLKESNELMFSSISAGACSYD